MPLRHSFPGADRGDDDDPLWPIRFGPRRDAYAFANRKMLYDKVKTSLSANIYRVDYFQCAPPQAKKDSPPNQYDYFMPFLDSFSFIVVSLGGT